MAYDPTALEGMIVGMPAADMAVALGKLVWLDASNFIVAGLDSKTKHERQVGQLSQSEQFDTVSQSKQRQTRGSIPQHGSPS